MAQWREAPGGYLVTPTILTAEQRLIKEQAWRKFEAFIAAKLEELEASEDGSGEQVAKCG